jgi:alkanesulfonate monooxygenase SsuD/methylene tetrahydromethanopterin reductase-like flavin-dependent oxidoreductase (luciferase family)
MSEPLRFGIITLQSEPWDKMVALWQSIEALNFDSVWVADHFVNYMAPNDPWFEAWTLLSGFAAVTKRIRIGTLVTSIPLRFPVILARQALTVDHISGGRLELGLGAGAPRTIDPVYRMTGIKDWDPPERVRRFSEAVEIIDLALRNRVTSYEGRYFKMKEASMAPAPIQTPRPPITIGALGPSMLKITAKYADAWNSYGGEWGAPPEQMLTDTKKRNQLLDKYCKELGRDPHTLRRSFLYFSPHAETVFDSEENFLNFIQPYRDIGITEYIFYYPVWYGKDQLHKFEFIGREVIPKLRKE